MGFYKSTMNILTIINDFPDAIMRNITSKVKDRIYNRYPLISDKSL